MKKTYINPELEVVKLHTMQMLAASVGIDDALIEDPGDIGGHGMDFDFSEDEFNFDEDDEYELE